MMCRSPEALWCDGRELLVRSRSARVPLQFAPDSPAPRLGLPVGAFAPRLTRKRDAEINHPSSFCVCLPLSVCCPCPAPLLFLNSRRRLFASIKEDPIDFPSPEWDPISAAARIARAPPLAPHLRAGPAWPVVNGRAHGTQGAAFGYGVAHSRVSAAAPTAQRRGPCAVLWVLIHFRMG